MPGHRPLRDALRVQPGSSVDLGAIDPRYPEPEELPADLVIE